MLGFTFSGVQRLLVLGAHSDDIEIGCGGTLLHLLEQDTPLDVRWVTFSANAERKAETHRAATAFLAQAHTSSVAVHDFRDSYFPWEGDRLKECFEEIARDFNPNMVLTHHRGDRHQDHRTIAEITWNTFRNHVVLEYEIAKWEGDLGQPNIYVPLSEDLCRRKIAYLMDAHASQRGRDWFTEDLFLALLRIRGMECRSPSGFAEAFHGPKLAFTGLS